MCLVPLLLILLLCYVILPCNYIINTYIPLYIASIRVYLSLWCIAGIIYDKAPLKGAYLLALLIFRVGIIIYLFLIAWLVSNTKKDNGNYIRYPLIIELKEYTSILYIYSPWRSSIMPSPFIP